MPEMTRVERARLDELKGKAAHPSAAERDANMRGEGEEIEFRRLTERLEAEERLEALRKQPERSREDLEEMRALGAPDDEIMAEDRKLWLASELAKTKVKAKDAPADERAAVRDTQPMQDMERAGHGHEQADRINRERDTAAFEERGKAADEAKAAENAQAEADNAADLPAQQRAERLAREAQAEADKAANLPAQQRAASERLAREADAVHASRQVDLDEHPAPRPGRGR